LNPHIGRLYRKIILAPGGSRDSIESLRLFLGREPSIDAYFKSKNFTADALKNIEKVKSYKKGAK